MLSLFQKKIFHCSLCLFKWIPSKKYFQNSNKTMLTISWEFELSQSRNNFLKQHFAGACIYKFYNKVVSMLIKDWNRKKNKSDSTVSYVFRHFKKTGMLANQNSWMPHNFMPRMAQLCFSAETSHSLQIHSTTNSLDTKFVL